jgi:hypothetical protein
MVCASDLKQSLTITLYGGIEVEPSNGSDKIFQPISTARFVHPFYFHFSPRKSSTFFQENTLPNRDAIL